MKFFDKIERKYSRYAIPNLMRYMAFLYLGGLLIQMTNPMFYYKYLMLDPVQSCTDRCGGCLRS